jgi:hypothetical protein
VNELRTLIRDALIVQAFDLRDTPYLVDACAAIAEQFERLALLRLERRQTRNAWIVRLLRETDPTKSVRRAAA